MVKKSKKSMSKRTPLRKKYKILKKVKEHHKKKAKEAKKLGNRGKARVEKDPGIPNAWPFREQELQALEARRAKALAEQEEKKEAKKERAKKRKLGLLDEEEEGLAKLSKDAARRGSEFDEKPDQLEESTSTSADGSRRAYYKEFQKVIEAADVVIQVLDARDPLGSRCVDVERMVISAGATKRIVLLLNKIDLVPKEVTEKWLKYLREELPTVAFKCSTQQQRRNLGGGGKPRSKFVPKIPQVSDPLGGETLLQLLKNYSRNQKLKTAITVGVVGCPNVGKSSLINSLKRTRAAAVGAAPGVTKVMQEIHLDKKVKLLDSPGIVFASAKGDEAAVTLRNCTRIEQIQDPFTPVKEILRLCSDEKLMSIYRVPKFNGVDELLQKVAVARGKLKKGGVPNSLSAARIMLHDWNDGKIPYFTLPPERHDNGHLESAIVAEWSNEFDINQVFKDEESAVLAKIPSLSASLHSEIAPRLPFRMDDGTGGNEEVMGEAEDSDDDHEEDDDADEEDDDDDEGESEDSDEGESEDSDDDSME